MYSIVLIVGGLSLSTVSALVFRDNKRKKLALIPFTVGAIMTLTGVFMRYR